MDNEIYEIALRMITEKASYEEQYESLSLLIEILNLGNYEC
jgi:hypothetical protein